MYVESKAALKCLKCPKGWYQGLSLNPVYKCKTCGKGQYAKDPNVSLCTICNRGKYQDLNVAAAYACKTCNKGQFAVDRFVAGCRKCRHGRFQNLVSAIVYFCNASLCGPGRYTVNTSSQACATCPKGHYQYLTSADDYKCKTCGKGQYAENSNVSSCLDCQNGRFQNLNVAASYSCNKSLCGPGKYTVSRSLSVCAVCSKGQYQSLKSADKYSCTKCPTGWFTNESKVLHTTYCRACPSGWFQWNASGSGKSSCWACQAGYYSTELGWNRNGTADANLIIGETSGISKISEDLNKGTNVTNGTNWTAHELLTKAKKCLTLTIENGSDFSSKKSCRGENHTASCRCVTKDKKLAISICNTGCGDPNQVCSMSFGCEHHERSCNSSKCTCKPANYNHSNLMTFDMCMRQCNLVGMTIPTDEKGVEAAKGTGCDIDCEEMWIDQGQEIGERHRLLYSNSIIHKTRLYSHNHWQMWSVYAN